VIRKLNPGDRELFLALAEEFYHSEAVLHPVPRSHMERTFAELMRSEEYVSLYLLEREGTAAGYVLLAHTWSMEAGGMVSWVEELYVRPAFRGQGVGSRLLEHVLEKDGVARFRLEVEPDNHRVKELYRRYGFMEFPYQQMVKEIGTDSI